MRLVFIDLHCNNFLIRPYSAIKSGRKIVSYKHKLILDYAVENNIKVCNFVSMRQSTKRIYGRFGKYIKSKYYYEKESRYVINDLLGEKLEVNCIFDKKEIRDDDIVIVYLYNTIQIDELEGMSGIKVMMGNHFVAINNPVDLNKLGVNVFVNEIDLEDNEFVIKFINTRNVKAVVLPYVFSDRFVNKHKNRKNKAMAIGTLSTCAGNSGYKLYRDLFKTEWIQTSRKMIYDNAVQISEWLDSYISYINEDKLEIKPNDSVIIKLYKKIRNRYMPWTQSKYTSFNMVDKFNEYKMFLCPEELVGMPGVGFVEGMACGTAYIGLDTSYYRKLGLVPGEHYISYDGTLEDLEKVVSYYQMHENELEAIAKNGEFFVRKQFNAQSVATVFFKELEILCRDNKYI